MGCHGLRLTVSVTQSCVYAGTTGVLLPRLWLPGEARVPKSLDSPSLVAHSCHFVDNRTTSSATGSGTHVPIFALGTCSFESSVRRMGYCIPMTEPIGICVTVEEYFRINVHASPFLASTRK